MSDFPVVDLTQDEPVEEPEDTDAPSDAFSPESAPGLSLVMLMRIYDVLMTQLRYDHGEEISTNLLDVHASGALLTPPPFFNGQFLHSLINSGSDEPTEPSQSPLEDESDLQRIDTDYDNGYK